MFLVHGSVFSGLSRKTTFAFNAPYMETSAYARPSAFLPGSRPRTPPAYRVCDGMTEAVLDFMIVFAPWAFGATERWSIWTLNIAAYALGGLLFAKWLIRWRAGYRPMRWGDGGAKERSRPTGDGSGETQSAEHGAWSGGERERTASKGVTVSLAALTVLVLAWCLTSALNARSTFIYREMAFVPHDCVAWLPHSYDSRATWQAFWMYLGLALTFWAARDWLLGQTARERRDARGEDREQSAEGAGGVRPSAFPMRLQRLLWVLCMNGALLALEGILQRLSGTNKLLWLVQPVINQSGELQFGPYAYRSNAAQYLNLLWPVCLGFWWTLRRATRGSGRAGGRVGGGPQVLLLPCAVLMAAAPIISVSRGGAIVAWAEILAALALLMFVQRKGHWLLRLGIILLFAASLALAGHLGWEKLQPRLKTLFSDDLGGRVEIYRNARQMARDFPWLGTGPGTFPWIYHLYRASAQSEWAAYAHNDWLETRITFGGIGFAMILAALASALLRWFGGGGIEAHWLFVSMIWLALAGCLLHARFDFPFQIYSTLALFLHLSAIVFCLSRGDNR